MPKDSKKQGPAVSNLALLMERVRACTCLNAGALDELSKATTSMLQLLNSILGGELPLPRAAKVGVGSLAHGLGLRALIAQACNSVPSIRRQQYSHTAESTRPQHVLSAFEDCTLHS